MGTFRSPSATSPLSPHSRQPNSSRPYTPDPDLPLYQRILSSSQHPVFSRMAILNTTSLPSHLHSLKRLALSDNASALHLQVSPPATVPLLRHERAELEVEATALRILADAGLPVPALIRHDPSPALMGAPFLLTTSLPGIPLAHILPSLSRAERRALDQQIDALEARCAHLTSSRFGPVNLVARGQGEKNWPDAFETMLASVLKDGEDMFVNLPYAQIRDVVKLRGCREALGEITEGLLCIGGFGGAGGVLVERDERGHKRVTGLVGFKAVWWGDRGLEVGGMSDLEGEREREGWEVVGRGRADVRALLYACYHATVAIVTSFYRPASSINELEARRTLTVTIQQLNAIAAS